jgi:hypothetical protein
LDSTLGVLTGKLDFKMRIKSILTLVYDFPQIIGVGIYYCIVTLWK